MSRLRNIITFGTDTFDPGHRFETSWLISPWKLFAIRAILVSSPSKQDKLHFNGILHNISD